MTEPLDRADVQQIVAAAQAATRRIAPHLRRTPWERSVPASQATGVDVWLKHEQQQVTGSFKPRGSLTKLSRLSEEERARGVVAPTAGNHGIGLAYAASRIPVPTRLYLPADADPAKLRTLRELGADVSFFPDVEAARLAAVEAAAEHGWLYSSAYNDVDMVVGAATLGLEIAEEMPGLDVLLVPIGGGGLAAGVAAALGPRPTEVWAVATAASPTWPAWHAAGSTVPVELRPSVAEGLSGPIEASTLTFPLVRDLVPRVLGVEEPRIAQAMAWLAHHHQQLTEPSGVAALAAALDPPSELAGARVGVLLTGRNIGLRRFLDLVAPFADEPR
jgi:threonine dehydratase